MRGKKTGVAAGVFDPVSVAHVDIIARAAKIFDKIYVAPFENSSKKTMFDIKQRLDMLILACGDIDNVTVEEPGNGVLLADYARSKGADFIIKGVRNIMDFEYELNMAEINRKLGDGIDTLFLASKPEYLFISSTFVREMILYGKDISGYVPEKAAGYIKNLMSQNK